MRKILIIRYKKVTKYGLKTNRALLLFLKFIAKLISSKYTVYGYMYGCRVNLLLFYLTFKL